MSATRWELFATFGSERAMRAAADAIRAGADHVQVESWAGFTGRPARKSSDQERAIAAVDRLCARVAKWNTAWMEAGEPAGVLWASYLHRQGWAGYADYRRTGYELDRLNAWIELLRGARTLLRERLDVPE